MECYREVIESLKDNTFDKHIKKLIQIKDQTSDSELKFKISNLISSLGSEDSFKNKHGTSRRFKIVSESNQSAEDLINYCQQNISLKD